METAVWIFRWYRQASLLDFTGCLILLTLILAFTAIHMYFDVRRRNRERDQW